MSRAQRLAANCLPFAAQLAAIAVLSIAAQRVAGIRVGFSLF